MGYPSFSVGDVLTANDMNAVGWYKLSAQTVSASAGPIQFNNVFTTNYDLYVLAGHFLWNTTAGTLTMQLQDASNNAVTSNYSHGLGAAYFTGGVGSWAIWQQNAAASAIPVGGSVAGDYLGFEMTFQRPRDAVKTNGRVSYQADNFNASFNDVMAVGGWIHTSATAYYGCRLIVSAGTITGTVTLYGVKK